MAKGKRAYPKGNEEKGEEWGEREKKGEEEEEEREEGGNG